MKKLINPTTKTILDAFCKDFKAFKGYSHRYTSIHKTGTIRIKLWCLDDVFTPWDHMPILFMIEKLRIALGKNVEWECIMSGGHYPSFVIRIF